MALPRVGLNEGSLLRRTLVHVGTFVLGSIAFVSLMSFVLVSIAKGLVPHPSAPTDATAQQGDDGEAKATKPSGPKGSRKKPPSAAAAAETPTKTE
jgi:hypothetical protein